MLSVLLVGLCGVDKLKFVCEKLIICLQPHTLKGQEENLLLEMYSSIPHNRGCSNTVLHGGEDQQFTCASKLV